MMFSRSFRLLTYGAALWAFLALVSTGQVHLLATVLFLFFFFLTVFGRRVFLGLPGWFWNMLSLVAFLVALYGWFTWDRMYSVTYFFFYLELNKLMTARKNRDYLQVYALTFFHMLAASVSTESVAFAPMMAVYIFLIIAALITFTIKRDAEAAFADAGGRGAARPRDPAAPVRLASGDAGVLRGLSDTRFFDRRIALWFSAMTVFVLVTGTVIFWIVPRTGQTGVLPGLSGMRGGQARSGFTDQINFEGLEDIQTDPTIVMRAQPLEEFAGKRPEFLRIRGTALDQFSGREWQRTTNTRGRENERDVNFISQGQPIENPGNRFGVRLTVEPEGSNYLFLVDQPASLKLPEPMNLAVDEAARAVRVPRPRYHPISYESIGILPEIDDNRDLPGLASSSVMKPVPEKDSEDLPRVVRESLRQFGFGAISDDPDERERARAQRGALSDEERERYLQLPLTTNRELIEEIARTWSDGLETEAEIAAAIAERLQSDFGYSLEVPFAGRDDHLEYFLTEARSGHCEYFATSMALMLRSLGIPSRVVNGYLTDEWSNASRRYLVRQEHAHSWVEAHLPGVNRWVTFDPTPASGVGSNRIDHSWYHAVSGLFDSFKVMWYDRVIDFNHEDQKSGMWALIRLLRSGSEGTALGASRLRQFWYGSGSGVSGRQMLGLGLLVLAAAGGLFLYVRARQGPRRKKVRGEHLVSVFDTDRVRPYLELMRDLEDMQPRPPAQTPLVYSRRLADRSGGLLEELVPVTRSYYDIRYNGGVWSPDLDEKVRQLRANLSTYRQNLKHESREQAVQNP